MGYSRAALTGASNDQAAMSVPAHVENYSEYLKLVTLRYRAWVRPSIPVQTTLFQQYGAVSNIASKCTGPETRAMQPPRERSDRTSPGERAGERILQPLFRDGGLCTILDLSPINERSASVRSEGYCFAPGTGCVHGFKLCVLSHSDSTASQVHSEFCSRGHIVPVPCSPVWAGCGPVHFLKVHGRSSSYPLRVSGLRVLNYLNDWLISAQSRDTPASHIDKLLCHLEFLRLYVNMRKSILAPSQSITHLGVCFD